MKKCPVCLDHFEPKRARQNFCSRECGYENRTSDGFNRAEPPMARNQALANAWLTNKPLSNLHQFVQNTFRREVRL